MGGGTILVSDGPGEQRVAVLDADGALLSLLIHRSSRSEAGAVVLGRVTGRLPDGSAAFVDIGEAAAGFLNASDAKGLGGLPPEGAAVMVQVAHAARRGKGARLTADVSFATDRLAFSPLRPGVAASARLPRPDAKRLAALVRGWLAEGDGAASGASGEGAVVRTAAAQAPEAALRADLEVLRAQWAVIRAAAAQHRPPPRRLSPPPDLLGQAVALCPQPEAVRVEGATVPAALRQRHPALAPLMKACAGDLFAVEGVDEQVDAALLPDVPLPCGGTLRIEPTAALVAVDVDAGPAPAAVANAEAVGALARQLLLRGLSGTVVLDAIPDRADRTRATLVAALRQALEDDPAAPYVAGATRLGLVEISRPRIAPPLADVLCAADGRLSVETVALGALRRVLREAAAVPAGRPSLTVAPAVADALRGPLAAALAEAEARLHRPLVFAADAGFDRERVEVAMIAAR